MKRWNRLFMVMTISMILILCTALSASAEDESNPFHLHQTSCTATTITVQWDNIASYQGTPITAWAVLAYDADILLGGDTPSPEDYEAYGECAAGTSKITLKGLSQGRIYGVALLSDTGVVSACAAYTKPDNIAKTDFVLYSTAKASTSTQFKVKFKANVPTYADGVEIRTYKYGAGTASSTRCITGTYSTFATLNKNTAYKYKARAYVVDPYTNKKCYGSWSKFRYFDNPNATYSTNSTLKGCKLRLKGVKGVAKYKIYVSTAKGKQGVLTKTVSPKAGTFAKYKINKIGKSYMKKGKTYYVNVVPYIKNGTSTPTKSEMYGTLNFRNPK